MNNRILNVVSLYVLTYGVTDRILFFVLAIKSDPFLLFGLFPCFCMCAMNMAYKLALLLELVSLRKLFYSYFGNVGPMHKPPEPMWVLGRTNLCSLALIRKEFVSMN